MRPSTDQTPKAMLPVAGRPFADWQLRWLAGQGVDRVVYSIGHLGHHLEAFVADGRRWGIDVQYVREEAKLLGTGGALRLAADAGMLEAECLLLYGDSYLSVDLAAVKAAFERSGAAALMTVLHNDGAWDRSNVIYQDGRVVLYEKASPRQAEMHHIDYGLLALSRDRVTSFITPGQVVDLAPVLTALSRRGDLAAFEVHDRFYEVGSPQGKDELERYLLSRG